MEWFFPYLMWEPLERLESRQREAIHFYPLISLETDHHSCFFKKLMRLKNWRMDGPFYEYTYDGSPSCESLLLWRGSRREPVRSSGSFLMLCKWTPKITILHWNSRHRSYLVLDTRSHATFTNCHTKRIVCFQGFFCFNSTSFLSLVTEELPCHHSFQLLHAVGWYFHTRHGEKTEKQVSWQFIHLFIYPVNPRKISLTP